MCKRCLNMFAASLTLRRVWLQVDMKIKLMLLYITINILFIRGWRILIWWWSWCDDDNDDDHESWKCGATSGLGRTCLNGTCLNTMPAARILVENVPMFEHASLSCSSRGRFPKSRRTKRYDLLGHRNMDGCFKTIWNVDQVKLHNPPTSLGVGFFDGLHIDKRVLAYPGITCLCFEDSFHASEKK